MSVSTPRILDVFVHPDIRRKRVTVTVETSAECVVRAHVENTAYETTGTSGTFLIELSDFTAWSPETPDLYALRCDIPDDGDAADSVTVPFGMRDFTVKEHRFHLNRRPLFVKGIALGADPLTTDALQKCLESAKSAGFNLLRVAASESFADCVSAADAAGLLLYADLIGETPGGVEETVKRFRNHPSIVMWGLPGPEHPGIDDLCAHVRALDPSRMIVADSGTANVTRAAPFYIQPYRSNRAALDALQIRQHAPIDRAAESYIQNLGSGETLTFLTGLGCADIGDIAGAGSQCDAAAAFEREFQSRELERLFGDVLGLAAASRELAAETLGRELEIARNNGTIAGYCVSELTDTAASNGPGIVDVEQRPKPALDRARATQQKIRATIYMPHTNLLTRQDAHVRIVLLNEARLEGRAELSLQVVGPTNQVLWKKKRGLKIPRHGKELWEGTISASGTAGPHRFVVRLMNESGRIAESSADFFVFERTDKYAGEIDVLDVGSAYPERCSGLAAGMSTGAPLHVIPPGPNTIRAYPDNELGHVLGQVKEGATALFFSPPDDWNDLADRIDPGIRATSRLTAGTAYGSFRYVKLHPVFDGLPARGLMGQQYRNVSAPKTLLESGEEDICGAIPPLFSVATDAAEHGDWGNDILIRRYGQGRIVFTHLRVLEHLGSDPVADTLFVNLLRHFARRTVAVRGTFPVPQEAVEWMRAERAEGVRRWMVVGMFPNTADHGLDTVFPPEDAVDLSATYPGWYEAISWRSWYARRTDEYVVDLQAAFSPVYQSCPRFDFGTGYAYAEFNSDARGDVAFVLRVYDATRIWLNGKLAHETRAHVPEGPGHIERIEAFVRQGRNTVLVKVAKVPGPFRFGLDVDRDAAGPTLKWWK